MSGLPLDHYVRKLRARNVSFAARTGIGGAVTEKRHTGTEGSLWTGGVSGQARHAHVLYARVNYVSHVSFMSHGRACSGPGGVPGQARYTHVLYAALT